MCSDLPLCDSQLENFKGVFSDAREQVALVSVVHCMLLHSQLRSADWSILYKINLIDFDEISMIWTAKAMIV